MQETKIDNYKDGIYIGGCDQPPGVAVMQGACFKACIHSDRGVQGGVPLICQISDIKACVRSDRGVQGGVPLICQISDIKLAFTH